MKALSWKNPFGTAMLYGKIETRVWDTNYRGMVLICLSKRPYNYDSVLNICGIPLMQALFDVVYGDRTVHFLGHAIATGMLVDSRPMKKEDETKTFVLYHPDLFCHVYEDVKPIKPFLFKGAQRWSNVDKSVIDSIEYL